MGNVFRRIYACLLCLLLVAGIVAAVPAGKVKASDDVANSESYKEVYVNNYDAIMADYEAGYTYIALVAMRTNSSIVVPLYSVVLTKEPIRLDYISYLARYRFLSDGHLYMASGQMDLSIYYLYQYAASNCDFYYNDKVCFNAKNLPDWFSVGDSPTASTAIPRCDLLTDYYNKEGNVVYYYYKDYPEYAFCAASDETLYIVNCLADDEEKAYKYVARVSDDKLVSSCGVNDRLYIYNAKLRTWQLYSRGSFSPSGFIDLSHMLNIANNSNFTIVSSNCALTQLDFDSSGDLLSKTVVSTGSVTGDMSFPMAPAPGLVETVQEITLSKTMTEIVGLVPLLVGLVISFLALRKGLAVLFRRLGRG